MSIVSSLRTGPFIEDEESFVSTKYKNLLKPKCSKSLKKKLKKYKLRKDGQEDPEVLDVSESFDLSLKLRSPTQSPALDANDNISCDDLTYPKNYIIKMVRRKQTKLSKLFEKEKKIEVSSDSQIISKNESEESHAINMKQKQTNAFKLLMDSRNKSIGSNSPGKERDNVEPESEEIILKKTIKAKRNLALQKLAEMKGSLKKKEVEKNQEEFIRRKMNKRAERLKNMITKGKKNQSRKKIDSTVCDIDENSSEINKDFIFENIPNEEPEILKENLDKRENKEKKNIVELDKNVISTKNKQICKDDEEFLNKLSPSLKKKENMLCYFKKVDKQPDSVILSDSEDNEKDDQPIKVKIITKSKRKLKKKGLSLCKLNEIVVVDDIETNKELVEISHNFKGKIALHNSTIVKEVTRKRKRNDTDKNHKINEDSPNNASITEGRPKRNIKKPVKYDDEVQPYSSDEDLHIFTPKKKKNVFSTEKEMKQNTNIIKAIKDENVVKHDEKSKKSISNRSSSKVASIFSGKSQVDVAAIEAKQKFLHSGMPEQLKKVIAHQKAQAIIAEAFYSVVHIQQNDLTPRAILNQKLFDKSKIESDHDIIIEMFTKNMICLGDKETKIELSEPIIPLKQNGIHSILHHIKENYPDFPVYRTYKTLFSKSKGDNKDFNSIDLNESSEVLNGTVDPRNHDPDYLSWTDKYKATSSKHIIGNFDSHGELKKWLISCTEKYANPQKCNEDSDSDFYNSDTDSRENMRFTNNLLVLTGPPGSGKTAGVYAIATDLAIKVIEVNVSSRRTGKILLQDLQEATQSHKVNRGKGSGSENSQNSQELIPSQGTNSLTTKRLKNKLKKATKLLVSSQKSNLQSQNSQEDGRTVLSLILIDDADIVFEQDDGFMSGIAHLVQSSKRPVILVTSSLTSPHLQKFLLCGNIVKMNPLSPKMLGTWLDIMCLADTGMCWPGTGAKFLDFYKGDMRKTINSLQFYAFSETQKTFVVNNSVKVKENKLVELDDENSSMSWAGKDCSEGSNEASAKCNTVVPAGIWKHFIRNSCDKMYMTSAVDLFNIWWGLPNIFENCYNNITETNKQSRNDLDKLSDIMDSISLADCISFKIKPDSSINLYSDPWHCPESDSVSEQETLEDVNSFSEISYSISQELVMKNINKFQERHNFQDSEHHVPGLLEQRKRDKILSRHYALSNAVHWNSMLDRRALALDYWPACRSICRIEKGRTDSNSKRNNRFFHYLKSAKVMCKNNVFLKLCDSLKPSAESDGNLE